MEKCNRPILQTLCTLACLHLSTGSVFANTEQLSMNEVIITDTRLTSGLPGHQLLLLLQNRLEIRPTKP